MTKLTWNQLIQINDALEHGDITDTYRWSEIKEQALRELPLLNLYLEIQIELETLNVALLATVKERAYARHEQETANDQHSTL